MKKYIIFGLLLLSSCGFSAQSKFYRLESSASDAVISSRRMNVGVEEVTVPQYVDRPQIVVMEAQSNELKVSEFHRWAEPLSSAIRRVLADDISLYLPNSLVKPQTYASESFNYTINVEINKFDAVLGQNVIFDAWWTIFKNGKVVARGRTKQENKLQNGYDGIAAEQSRMINIMAQQIAQKLTKL